MAHNESIGALAEDVVSVGMEQNIFDVSDDISFPWLPAYAEATEASPLNTTSSRMLETIVEETSDDDDGRDKDQGGTQQPLSWSQYDHVWSSGGSDAESVIRVETPSDQDTMSERDFICPPKRRKQETSFGDEFLASDLSAIYGRRPRICEPDGLEANEYFMKRHNEQRLRFDEIGHDLFTDSDSLSYASLSRSSSLIQFESLERQLQNETSVNQHPLSGSSPSLYTTESNTASPGAYHGGETGRGKPVPPAINGGPAGSNLLTTSNLIQKSIAQTALNISDSELYSTSSSVSSTGSCSGPDSSSNASTSTSSNSSSSSGFRYTDNRVGVEDRLVDREADRDIGTWTTPEDAGDTEEELLSATVRCHSSRCSERQRQSGRGISARNKNSIESLSEDSGYCDHLQQHGGGGGSMNSGGSGGLRARSKSLTNFGSAENITFVCGNNNSGGGGGGMFPSTLLPVPGSLSVTQQLHEQQQPLSLDCIAMEVRHVVYHENRLSTVCDVDEEDEQEEQEQNCDDGCSRDAKCIVASPTPATIDRQHAPQQAQLWTNINNGTKIEHGSGSCKQRTGESRQQGVESGSRTVTSMASSSSSRSEIKNSTPVGRTRLRPVLSLSAPDLLVGVDRQRRHRRQTDDRTSSTSSATVGLYDPISFTVSSVPECLNLYGGGVISNRSRHGSFDSDSASSEFLRHGYAGACGESVASKNFNLYDLQPQRPVKCTKTVTFQTGSCTSSPSRPKQNIRASYANLTALNYSDDEEDDPVYGGRRGHEYYLSRNTFRTSSGTRLGGGSRTANAIVPRTTLLTVPMDHQQQRGHLPEKSDVSVVVEEELADDEESSIFPVDRDEKSVFHSLLEEMSAHFDRNLSIINDQAEAYEPIAAFLHEQRSSSNTSGSGRLHATLGIVTPPPQAPPRRTQIKTNPHLPQQVAVSPSVPPKLTVNPVTTVVTPPPPPGTTRRRTFDQDPTNLVTCYAASLERCTFDPTESSTTSLGPTSDLHTNGGVALPRYVPVPVKREFVASTPNLHYYHGTIADNEGGEDSRPDHHNSLRNVSTCRSTGSILATASSSRCGLSKGVSFCPIVSEIIWKSTGSSDLEPDDNGSVISNQDFEIDIDDDDFEADDLDHMNLQLENGRTATADDRYANTQTANTRPSLDEERSQRNGVPEREHTNGDRRFYSNNLQSKNKSEGELYAMIREEDGYVQHPTTLIANDRTASSVQLNGANGAGVTMTSSDLSYAGDLSSAEQASRIRMSDTNGAGVVLVADERRNGGNTNGAMASRNLIVGEQMRLVNSGENVQGKGGSAATMPNQYTNNSSLIKNFKNGKAEKKGKTFLSRISSGFRFSFRNKSKKGATGSVGGLKESSSFTAPTAVNNNNSIHAKVGRGGSTSASGNDSASADFIYIPLKDPRKQNHRPDEPPSYLQRQISAAGVTVDDSFTGAEDEPDDCEIAVTRPGGGYYRSDSSTALNGDSGTGAAGEQGRAGSGNHVLSSKPPLPKQPPRVVGVCAKRSSTSPASLKHAHAQRATSTPPRESEQDELDSTTTTATMSSSYYQRRSPSQHQYAANGSYGSYHGGADTLSVEGYGDEDEYYYGVGGDGRLLHRGSIMGSEQKIGLIETNLDTHETIISGKTRSLMELGGGQHYRGYHHLQQQQQQQHQQQPSAGAPHGHHQLQVHDPAQRPTNGIKDHHHHHRQPGTADGPGRPHKSMEFLLDKENQRNVLVSLCLKRFLCFFVSTRLDQSL
uniref:Uncharacterized protein n=1 Tax=Anopheles minimus TaxID=112268 RepID=A0A182WA23_9DIPT